MRCSRAKRRTAGETRRRSDSSGESFAGAAPLPATVLSIIAIGAPVATVWPSLTISSRMRPATGEGTSALTLSVEISTKASYFSTLSPTRLSQCETVPSVTVSPSWGIVIVVSDMAVR